MVDTETLGTKPGSIILSIGAVAFMPTGDGIGDKFYANIDSDSCKEVGLTFDQSTVDWWTRQGEAAKKALTDPVPAALGIVASQFAAFYRRYAGGIWSNGATFDIPLIEAAMRSLGKLPPWKYWDHRDTRTLFNVCGSVNDRDFVNQFREGGVARHALDDAIAQAKAVQHCYRQISGWKLASVDVEYLKRKNAAAKKAGV